MPIVVGQQRGLTMDAVDRMLSGRLSSVAARVLDDPETRAQLRELAWALADDIAARLIAATTLEAARPPDPPTGGETEGV
jgi:hypothetical protein